ncbi:hypothetical protein N9A49_05865 [Salibacteraceae bacterium]|nr:hypothetical protein [Salibacteraceae bacterium]
MNNNHLYIYSVKRNHRLNYIISELVECRMGLEVDVVTNIDEFRNLTGPRLNYSEHKIEDVPHIFPAKLIFEKRVQEQDLDLISDGLFRLYSTKANELGFDPFAAAFYFLSMYEQYLPHREDAHGRFSFAESVVVKHKVHQLPLVEHYAIELSEWLQKQFPELKKIETSSSISITIDVDQLFAIRAKGLARSILGFIADGFRGRLLARIAVLSGRTPDPNEIYDKIIGLCQSHNVPLTFFFQVGENSRFDINNPPHLNEVKQRINELALSADVGVHPSYYTSDDFDKMESEIERLRSILTTPVSKSRQHYLRYKLPKTFRNLSELGISEDYSVGFTDFNGFRASTCKPFRFFDLERDEITPITIYPMCTMDACSIKQHHNSEKALEEMISLKKAIERVGGIMITTWHVEVMTAQTGSWPSYNLLEQFLAHE